MKRLSDAEQPNDLIVSLTPNFPVQRYQQTVLFFCHTLQADARLDYQQLAKQWPFDLPILGIQATGLHGEPMPESIEALAAKYVSLIRQIQPNGPYLLAAWSLGGSIIYAMAEQLRQQQQQVHLIGLDSVFVPYLNQSPDNVFGDFLYQFLAHEYQLKLSEQQLRAIKTQTKAEQVEAVFRQLKLHLHDAALKQKAKVQQQLIEMSLRFNPKHQAGVDLIVTNASQQQHQSDTLGWPEQQVLSLTVRDGADHFTLLLGQEDDQTHVEWLAKQLYQKCQNKLELQHKKHFQLPHSLQNFTGRSEELEKLNQKIQKPTIISDGKQKTQRVSGTGGVGKTQLAVAFCHSMLRQGFISRVIWLHAGGDSPEAVRANLLNQFYQLGERFGFSRETHTAMEMVKAVYQRLSLEEGVMVVFDDANSSQEISGFMPPATQSFKTLITTRDSNAWDEHQFDNVPLDIFSEKDASDYVTKVLTTEKKWETLAEEQHIALLCETLGRFPLALAQAVYYIVESGISINGYIGRYQEYADTLLDRIDFDNPHEKSLWITLKLSLDKIDDHNANTLLTNCCFLAPEMAIPEKLLEIMLGNKMELESALSALKRYSLLEPSHRYSAVKIHKLVQAVILKLRQYQTEELTIFKTVTASYLNTYLNQSEKKKPAKQERMQDTAFPHLTYVSNTDDEFAADLASSLALHRAAFFTRHGDYQQSERECRMAQKSLSAMTEDTKPLQRELHYLQVENKLGSGSRVTLNALARDVINLDQRFQEGLPLRKWLKQALQNMRILENTNDMEYERYVNDIVLNLFMLRSQSDQVAYANETAEIILTQAMIWRERGYNACSGMFAFAAVECLLQNHMASLDPNLVSENTSTDAAAMPQRIEFITNFVRTHQDSVQHPTLVRALLFLATTYSDVGDYDKVLMLTSLCVERLETYYGQKHLAVVPAITALAAVKLQQGLVLEATRELEAILALAESGYHQQHPKLLPILYHLAQAYSITAHPAALSTAKRARALLDSTKRDGHYVSPTLLMNILALRATTDPFEYEVELERQFRYSKTLYAYPHQLRIAHLLQQQALFYFEQNSKKFFDAQIACMNILERRHVNQEYARNHAFCLGVAFSLKFDSPPSAMQLEILRDHIQETEKRYGEQSFFLIELLNTLAQVERFAKPAEELRLRQRALEIAQHIFGEKHFNTSKLLFNLALSHGRDRDYATQLSLLTDAKNIIETEIKQCDDYQKGGDLATVLYVIAATHLNLGHKEQATQVLLEAMEIYQAVLPNQCMLHQETLIFMQNLLGPCIKADVMLQQGHYFTVFARNQELLGAPVLLGDNPLMPAFEQEWQRHRALLEQRRFMLDGIDLRHSYFAKFLKDEEDLRAIPLHKLHVMPLLSKDLSHIEGDSSPMRVLRPIFKEKCFAGKVTAAQCDLFERLYADASELTPATTLQLARLLLTLDQADIAMQLLQLGFVDHPCDESHYLIASCQTHLGRYTQALETVSAIIRNDRNIEALKNSIIIRQDQQRELQHQLQQQFKSTSQLSCKELILLAKQFRKVHDYTTALELLSKAEHKQPDETLLASLYFQRAKCYNQMQDIPRALENCQQSFQLLCKQTTANLRVKINLKMVLLDFITTLNVKLAAASNEFTY